MSTVDNADTILRQTLAAFWLLKPALEETISGSEQLSVPSAEQACLCCSTIVPHNQQCAYIEAVKEVILRLLVLHEQLKILKHLQKK